MNIHHHNLDEEFRQKVEEGFEKMRMSQEMGTNERIRYIVDRPGQEPLVFFEKVEGYTEENGELVQTQDRLNRPLDCGCLSDKQNPIFARDNNTGEIVCPRCICRCFECNIWIAIKNAKEVKGAMYCSQCATKVKVKQVAFFPFRMIKRIGLGLVGISEEPNPVTIAPQAGETNYGQATQTQQRLRPGA